MDSNSLYYSLELVNGSGHTLNVEQRTALQTSLVILKKNYKFHRVLFWGKILGLKEDYFIAQGRGEDEMKDKKNLYSFNCMDWFLIPPATDSMIEDVSKAAKGRFMGDPSYVYEHLEIRRQGEVDDAIEEEEVVTKVNEESRLAVAVHQIDEEVSVVPRGAFVKSPHGLVQINRSFGGLSDSEAGKLDNFFHFSEPKNLKKKSILEMGDLNPAIDFLDVLTDDIPKVFAYSGLIMRQLLLDDTFLDSWVLRPPTESPRENYRSFYDHHFPRRLRSWSLQFELARKVCVLRSLLWLGLTAYHVPMTPQHGYIYIGDGAKNLDLPFML